MEDVDDVAYWEPGQCGSQKRGPHFEVEGDSEARGSANTERVASQCQLLRNPAGRCESVHLHGTLFTKTLRHNKIVYRFSQA